MKKCTDCKNYFDESNFHKENGRKDGLSCRCKPCVLIRNKAYRENYPGRAEASTKNWIANNRDKVGAQKMRAYYKVKEFTNRIKDCGCCMCGELDKDVLDFHHLFDKDKAVTNIHTFKAVIAELLKCSLVCANCHRKLHAGTISNPTPLTREYIMSKIPFVKGLDFSEDESIIAVEEQSPSNKDENNVG